LHTETSAAAAGEFNWWWPNEATITSAPVQWRQPVRCRRLRAGATRFVALWLLSGCSLLVAPCPKLGAGRPPPNAQRPVAAVALAAL